MAQRAGGGRIRGAGGPGRGGCAGRSLAGGGLFALGLSSSCSSGSRSSCRRIRRSCSRRCWSPRTARSSPCSPQEGQRFIVPLDEVNPVVVDALLSAEDRRFYEHGGLDPIGIGRARGEQHAGLWHPGRVHAHPAAREERVPEQRAHVHAQGTEAVLSIKLERSEDKDRILERYLNTVYFGRGAYGSKRRLGRTSTSTSPTSTRGRPRSSSGCSGRRSRLTRSRTWRRPRAAGPA